MGHDVAEDLKALADELSALSNVRIQHVEVAHVLVADIAGSGSHAWASKEPRDESRVALFHSSSKPLPLGFGQWLSCCLVEAVKLSILEDLELSEAARLQRLVLPPLPFSFGLVRHLKVLGREQLMWMLSVGVGVVVLVLRDVEALELHVLLSTRGRALDSRLPPGLLVRFCSLVEPLCLHLEDLEQELSHSKQGVHLRFERRRRDLVLEGEPEGVCVSYQQLHSRVASSEAWEDEAGQALDLLPDV